jgi:hypothetical protein
MIRQANRDDWIFVSDISARAGYDDYINAHHGPAYLDTGNVYLIVEENIEGFIKEKKFLEKKIKDLVLIFVLFYKNTQ